MLKLTEPSHLIIQTISLKSAYGQHYLPCWVQALRYSWVLWRNLKRRKLPDLFFDSHPTLKVMDYRRNIYQEYYNEDTSLLPHRTRTER